MDSIVEEQGTLDDLENKRQERDNPRGFKAAVVSSLVFHLLAIFLIVPATFYTSPDPTPGEVVAPRVSMTVSLRQFRARNPEQPDNRASAAPSLRSGLQSARAAPVRPLPLTPADDAKAPLHASSENPFSTTPSATEGAEDATAPAPDSAQVSQMISNYMRSYRGGPKADWSDPCQRYHDPLLANDCPEQVPDRGTRQLEIAKSTAETFTDYISGHDRNQRAIQSLLKEMNRLRPLMAGNPALARLASEKYYEAEKQYLYLGGETSNKNHFMSVGERALAESITLFAFSVPLSLGGLKEFGKKLSGQQVPIMAKPYSPPAKAVSPPSVSDIPAFKLTPAPLGKTP